jgi:peptidyl-prolyl cis-trans isomerase D|tara:strand:- start:3553 stop:5436 length:1884 start_codon:yes stop_codon:yes gene_type:complete
MLEKIRNNTQSKFAKVILAIIIVPFALFGIDSYLSSSGSNVWVAKVNGESIGLQSYQNALLGVREQMTEQGESPDPAVFENPEFKKAVLEGLITSRLIHQEIIKSNFNISQDQLNEYVVNMPNFQRNGKFDQATYDQIAKNANLTPRKLDEEIRKDMAKQQVKDSLKKLVLFPEKLIKPMVNIAYQKRDVSLYEMRLEDYKKKIKVSKKEAREFYDANKSSFIMPEQVKINFIVYSVAGIIPTIKIENNEIKKYFEDNIGKFQGNQKRKAKHILLGFNSDVSADEKEKIKNKAKELLKKIKKSPKEFDTLAKKFSQDSESAKKGGDLGFFSRGMMVKEFEDVVFKLKKNQLSNIVETEYGYHIIMLTDIKGEEVSFDSVKAQIKGELIFSKAQEIYLSQAENFNNIVYEQSDSLKPAAEKFGIEIQDSQWLSADAASKFFNNNAFSQAVFDPIAISEKKNIAAIEVSPNNLISARVVDFKKSAPKSFEDAEEEIRNFLATRNSQKLLIEDGDNLILALKSGDKKIDWIDELVIDRIDKQGLSDPIVEAIFKINSTIIPNFEGIYDPNTEEYIIVRLNKTITDDVTDELSVDIFKDEYMQALTDEIDSAYTKDLREAASVKINQNFFN